ncbi:Putative metal chaperone YciC [Vibrio ruber DSM 16370]|uniref:Putative metal chaperone YciC n=1 Tax=Vibrio ruber (strain DSM 16370 / JCM 11486 / BCRC 17186 / CECT 7878 / LMG 23124 / VR1) TaxID=1123498 RepID=A0A1R4LCF2_VIBR1|nr:GTP-binding protein [Vibrio ruber]SJN54272.1 Putative metal chaperone YciC [Vibrio ruber DSM 16370]
MTQRIPANIITGFLGTGKTTAILNLLKNKPANQNWAVLVNEFGEIGIDGTLLSQQNALVKEVPGGCMCCTAGVPMSVGITALLRQKPDRLLIEPTGLGHPREIVATLTSVQYQPYLDLKATIALVDPRNLSNHKYTTHQNFNDQLACADVIIGNKVDQCQANDIDTFNDWVTDQQPAKIFHKLTRFGDIPLEVLELPRRETPQPTSGHASTDHHHAHAEPVFQLAPGEKYLRKENQGDGYYSCGWVFGAEIHFSFDALFSLFSELTAERIKAVINTDRGCYAFNVNHRVVSVHEISLDGFESKIEVIDSQLMPWDELEQILLGLGQPAEQ